jgi:hypothetical protein
MQKRLRKFANLDALAEPPRPFSHGVHRHFSPFLRNPIAFSARSRRFFGLSSRTILGAGPPRAPVLAIAHSRTLEPARSPRLQIELQLAQQRLSTKWRAWAAACPSLRPSLPYTQSPQLPTTVRRSLMVHLS